MNTLQLPRDIEKALQLSWDDMHPLTEKYKSEIAEKLSTIMCKKNVSCRSKSILRYLNSVYNIKLTQGVGIRTLLINNSVLRMHPATQVGIMTKPLRGDAISNP